MSQEDLNQEIKKAYEAFNGLNTKEMLNDKSNFPESYDIFSLLFQARQNYIRYFSYSSEYPLKDSFSNDNIFSMHSSHKKFIPENFPSSAYLDYLKKKIVEAYTLPEKFASAIQNFFIKIKDNVGNAPLPKKNIKYEYLNKSKISIFANVIIPSIFGFYIDESQASFGFDFICFLFKYEYAFYKPFFLSYLMSATTFLDIFWGNFILQVTTERYNPSLYQLKEIFFSSLKSSIPFFSTYHIQLLKNCLLRDYNIFFDLLFTQFLFPSFFSYEQYSLISQQHMDLLHEYIMKSDEFAIKIQDFFHQYNFADSQKAQFLIDEIYVILSQHEAKLLFDLFHEFDITSNSSKGAIQPKVINPIYSTDIDQFSPCSFKVRIDSKILTEPFKRGPTPHFTKTISSIKSKPVINNDIQITYALLKIDCEENRINPLSIITDTEEISPNDTFEIKQLKNKYKDYQDLHSLQTKSLYLMKDDIDRNQKDFYSFLLQQQRISITDDVKYRIQKRFYLLEEPFYSHFDVKLQPQPITIKSININQSDVEPFFEYRPSFVQLMLSLFDDLKFNEFVKKNKLSLQKVSLNVSYLDSVDIPDRLNIMERNILSVNSICKGKEDWIHPIFIKCFSRGALRTLYETFILISLYKNQNAATFQTIKNSIQKVVKLFLYILNQLKNHIKKNPDDENIAKIIDGITQT